MSDSTDAGPASWPPPPPYEDDAQLVAFVALLERTAQVCANVAAAVTQTAPPDRRPSRQKDARWAFACLAAETLIVYASAAAGAGDYLTTIRSNDPRTWDHLAHVDPRAELERRRRSRR